ncbi:unnamed protein product [Rotaria sp. Silwood1]|nr:unnamed protein product [Rotaria sp. Silwood1]
MSKTSIESLSNELFNEIFDYLDGSDIYQAFSNLNHRFQYFLNSSSFPLKITVNSSSYKSYTNTHQQLLFNTKHRVISLHLILPLQNNEFFLSYSIDSSFNRLESLVLFKISPSILLLLLTNLTCLPRLFSLTIDTQRTFDDLTEVYRLIFVLPKLKYMKCSARGTVLSMSLPIAKKERLTNIEYLVINHSCTFNQVSTIISYTPELYHLNLMKSYDNYFNNEMILPMNLFILRATRLYERDYLDADRWQQLIEDYLPDLEEFYLQYHEKVDPEAAMSNALPSDNFRSLFWIERQWLMNVEMNSLKIVCSIRPYRKRWYDINSSIELSKSTQLTVWSVPDDYYYSGLLKLTIGEILTITQIYHLEISEPNICSTELIELIDKLPGLDSLKIFSLKLLKSIFVAFYEHKLYLAANKNNITKVYLFKMNSIEEVYFLIRFCPRITYLKVNLNNNVDYEVFLKDLLMKINNDGNQYLRLLCLYIPTANNEMISKFKDMINLNSISYHRANLLTKTDLFDSSSGLPSINRLVQHLQVKDRLDKQCALHLVNLAQQTLEREPNILVIQNHETHQIAEAFQFKLECQKKYGSMSLYDACMIAFDTLPICAVIDSRFLCMHGGIPPDIQTLSDIEKLNRFMEIPYSDPLCDFLWSDLSEDFDQVNEKQPDFKPNNVRGCSHFFSYNPCRNFLFRNNLLLIIRGHEVQKDE